MRLGGLLFYFIALIVWPIIKGLLEAENTKKNWREKQQNIPKHPMGPFANHNEMDQGSDIPQRTASPLELDIDVIPDEGQKIQHLDRVKTMPQKSKKTHDLRVHSATEKKLEPDRGFDYRLDSINREDILRGIVMSEILGPPKAMARGGRR